MMDLDHTLIFQIVAYFALLFVLNRILFQPVISVIEERKKRTEGALKDAEDTESKVAEGVRDYERRLKEAVVRGQEARAAVRQEALSKEKAVMEAARVEANAEVGKVRTRIEKDGASALTQLKKDARGISKSVAEKIIDRKVIAGIALVLAFLPSLVLAANGGGGGHEEGSAIPWKFINFCVLLVGLYLVWRKWIKGFLEQRTEDIRTAIEDAERAKAEAEAKQKEYEEKLGLLDKKVEEIHAGLKLGGEAEREKILKEAAEAAAKLKEQAKLTAEQEVKKAKLSLQKELARLSVEMAGEILSKEINPEDQKKLMKDYLERLKLN
ncbi:MAG: ATP synthase F0 subunit B [Thermodesulfobacteriota bacterium]